MSHVIFAFYALSALSGVLLVSNLSGHPEYRQTDSFKSFMILYLLITLFVCSCTVYLYWSINLPAHYVSSVFIATILLFLGCLPVCIALHIKAQFSVNFPNWFIILLYLQSGVGLVLASLIQLVDEGSLIILVVTSISLMLLSLICIVLLSCKSEKYKNRTSMEKRLSRIMLCQSLLLPFLEQVLFSEHTGAHGISYSLPTLFLINNVLIWHFKTLFFPISPLSIPLSDELEKLSPKEKQIVQAAARGLSNKQIAFELNISPSTVKNHMYSIFKKYQVSNRLALVTHLHKTTNRE